jgi:4'-phosphopantetheinyl transferase
MIHWLSQPASALPPHAETLLSPAEAATYAALKAPKRRSDWLLGRITAKQLVAEYLGSTGSAPSLNAIVIAADPDGAPYASMHGARLPFSLSISHSHDTALCALVAATGKTVGCDIEYIEARDAAFLSDFFTPAEQVAALAWPEPHTATTLLWSAKEAVLKALREGLRIDTKQVQITLPNALDDEWATLGIALDPALAQRFPGAWSAWARRSGDFVQTMALCAAADAP